MITDLIDLLAQFVVSVIDQIGYAGIFVLMLVESCGIPMPSEVIMPFSGFLVATGELSFWWVVVMGAVGNLVGSILAYWIGARGGRALIEKYGRWFLISRHDLDLADRVFKKYGDWVVFAGRLLPVVRTYISFPAGIAKMDFRKFCLFTFAGALPWCILFTWLGVKMGENWEQIRETLHNFDMAMLVLVIASVALYILRHVLRSRKDRAHRDSHK